MIWSTRLWRGVRGSKLMRLFYTVCMYGMSSMLSPCGQSSIDIRRILYINTVYVLCQELVCSACRRVCYAQGLGWIPRQNLERRAVSLSETTRILRTVPVFGCS